MDSNRKSIDQLNMKFQLVAVIVGVVLFVIKMSAYLLSNSNAILTDALEGLVNILAAAFGVFSLYYTSLPKDQNHPYGHGKIEFISSGFEGGLILVAGSSMIVKAAYSFFYPEEVIINFFALGLVALAGIVNSTMGWSMVKQGEKVNSIQLQAGGRHLLSDGYSTVGLLLGLGVVWLTDLQVLDNVLAIILGGVISVTGVKIIRKSIAGVMDEADPEQMERVAKVLEEKRKSSWVDIHNFRIVRYGAKLHLDAHLTLPWYNSLKASHDEVDQLEDILAEVFENDIEASIHTEPCLPLSCEICSLDLCQHRKHSFLKRIAWTGSHIYSEDHHKASDLE